MPCECPTGWSDGSLKTELDKVTRLLCELCKFTDPNDLWPEIKEWYFNHKKLDEQRLKEEKELERIKKVKKQAMEKLSTEEKVVLGLL